MRFMEILPLEQGWLAEVRDEQAEKEGVERWRRFGKSEEDGVGGARARLAAEAENRRTGVRLGSGVVSTVCPVGSLVLKSQMFCAQPSSTGTCLRAAE